MAIWLFAVGGQEFGPPRAHVARQVFHDERDAVCLWIQGCEEVLVGRLTERLVRLRLEFAELKHGILEELLLDHGSSLQKGRVLAVARS